MGYYINPGGWPPENPGRLTKEEFLAEHGIEETDEGRFRDWERVPKGMLPVVWIHNGPFTAAGIAYSPRELLDLLIPDWRPKWFYYVEIEILLQVSDLDKCPYYPGKK